MSSATLLIDDMGTSKSFFDEKVNSSLGNTRQNEELKVKVVDIENKDQIEDVLMQSGAIIRCKNCLESKVAIQFPCSECRVEEHGRVDEMTRHM